MRYPDRLGIPVETQPRVIPTALSTFANVTHAVAAFLTGDRLRVVVAGSSTASDVLFRVGHQMEFVSRVTRTSTIFPEEHTVDGYSETGSTLPVHHVPSCVSVELSTGVHAMVSFALNRLGSTDTSPILRLIRDGVPFPTTSAPEVVRLGGPCLRPPVVARLSSSSVLVAWQPSLNEVRARACTWTGSAWSLGSSFQVASGDNWALGAVASHAGRVVAALARRIGSDYLPGIALIDPGGGAQWAQVGAAVPAAQVSKGQFRFNAATQGLGVMGSTAVLVYQRQGGLNVARASVSGASATLVDEALIPGSYLEHVQVVDHGDGVLNALATKDYADGPFFVRGRAASVEVPPSGGPRAQEMVVPDIPPSNPRRDENGLFRASVAHIAGLSFPYGGRLVTVLTHFLYGFALGTTHAWRRNNTNHGGWEIDGRRTAAMVSPAPEAGVVQEPPWAANGRLQSDQVSFE